MTSDSRSFKTDQEFAHHLDRQDPLRKWRERFYQVEGHIYMDGNSCGLFSKDAEASLLEAVEHYKKNGIECWSKGPRPLFTYQDLLGNLAAPLVGAEPGEVTVHSNTTINIHTAIATFYHPTTKRYKIMVDDLNFPTDRYAVESQIALKGLDPEQCVLEINSKDGLTIDEDDVIKAMSDEVALIHLPSVLYRSGQLLDMERITAAALDRGIIIGWDLCHSAGTVPHALSKIGADYAVWCTYKYMNGGPGSVACLYINKKHHHRAAGLAGWHGYVKEKQFDLLNVFEKAAYAGGWQTGTQHIFSMAPLEGSFKMFNQVGVDKIRAKSLHLTAYLMFLIERLLTPYGFSIGNPREDHRRGGHVALMHSEAVKINAAMKKHNIIPDFRQPDVIRIAPAALYNTYYEVFRVVTIIENIIKKGEHHSFSERRGTVA